MKLAWIMFPALCALGTAALSGCSVALEPEIVLPREETGSVTVNWLVAGSSHPLACARFGAEEMELVVYDEDRRPVARETASCRSFSISLSLPEGRYTADVRLLGAGQRSASTSRTLEDIDIVAGTDLAINVDFPADSLQ